MCLEMPSTLSLCVSYVGHIPSGNFKTSIHDIFNGDKEGLLNFEDDTLGENESGRDLSPWLRLPFDPDNFLGCEGWIVVGLSTCLSELLSVLDHKYGLSPLMYASCGAALVQRLRGKKKFSVPSSSKDTSKCINGQINRSKYGEIGVPCALDAIFEQYKNTMKGNQDVSAPNDSVEVSVSITDDIRTSRKRGLTEG
ncbi:hypothetical protein T459_31269 [Capsicum annuum]|uniref:Uncharacterized protein n=1 Tax=Capsicum annuum TaxID=4072 RepID=A0A2G2YAU9_CAPAN|nr:hypothetical protein T459_31269 [Capsicum annuum]